MMPKEMDILTFRQAGAWQIRVYGHPRILSAIERQLEKLSFAGPISVISEESVALAEELIELLPGSFDKKVWYGHSGSDANEFISKIVPLYTGKPKDPLFHRCLSWTDNGILLDVRAPLTEPAHRRRQYR